MNTKIILTFGSIGGIIVVSSWFIKALFSTGEMEMSELEGYTIMLVALSSIFLGIRKVKSDMGGKMSFKTAFFTGLGITFIASIIYVIGWQIFMPNFLPDFPDKYAATQIELVKSSEISNTEKAEKIEEISGWTELYKKPYVMAGFSFIEIFPVGLIVSILSALILSRKSA